MAFVNVKNSRKEIARCARDDVVGSYETFKFIVNLRYLDGSVFSTIGLFLGYNQYQSNHA